MDNKTSIGELRPVEALYLLAWNGEEKWEDKNKLAAVLGYLANYGFVEPKNKKLGLTSRKPIFTNYIDPTGPYLRPYEYDAIIAIDKGDKEKLLKSVKNFNFKGLIYNLEYLTSVPHEHGAWIVKWTDYKNEPNDKYRQAIEELELLKRDIKLDQAKAKVEELEGNPRKIDSYYLSMSYAFPSAGLVDGYMEYASEVVKAVNEAIDNTTIIIASAAAAAAVAGSGSG